MKIQVLLIAILIVSPRLVLGQNINMEKYRGNYVAINRVLDYSAIDGSPYLEDNLIGGVVKFNSGDSLNHFMRYNLYSDEIEYLDDGQLFTILKPQMKKLEYIHLNGNTIVYKEYYIRKQAETGYLLRLVKDRYSLYKRLRVEFQDAVPAKTSLHEPTPAHFVAKNVQWFYSLNGKPISFFKADNKWLREIGLSYYDVLKSFVKKEHLKLRKEEDLITLFKYYNSLLENALN